MYNGPSGPRILLTMEISSAHAAVAANIAPTAKQRILLALIFIRSDLTADPPWAQFRGIRKILREAGFPGSLQRVARYLDYAPQGPFREVILSVPLGTTTGFH